MRLALVFVAELLVLCSCGGGDGGGTTPTDTRIVKGTVNNNVVSLPVSIEGVATMPFIADTGTPLTLVDPSRFASLGLDAGVGQITTLDVGGVHLQNVNIVALSPCGQMVCSGSQPAGLLGGAVFVDFQLTFDYRAATVGFGASAIPAGAGAPVTIAFDLAGGHPAGSGLTPAVAVPATRIVVDVAIEGTTYPFVLDTGSSPMVLKPDLYDTLVADGRDQGMTQISTVNGTVSQPSTSLKMVAVGGASQSGVHAVRSPLDLDRVGAEVGVPVAGLLGGSYLANYIVTIDYPGRRLTLRTNP